MNNLAYQHNIEEIDFETVSDEILEQNYHFSMVIRKENDPDEPDLPQDLWMKIMRQVDPKYSNYRWMIREGKKVIALATLTTVPETAPNYETDKHISFLRVNVLPDYRQQGYGSRLTITSILNIKEIETITTVFSEAILESGKKFNEKFGGKVSQTGSENRLRLDEVNWDLINNWKQAGEQLGEREDVKIEHFHDCPEDILTEYTDLYTETMNQQPLGDYDGKIIVTPQSRRDDEQREKERGLLWYTMITRESDGSICGLTEMYYHPSTSHKGYQNLTGVKEKYRGRGLGKWLKAHMLEWYYAKYPDIKYITTGNATTNKPMLSINDRMGFKKFLEGTSYSFKKEDLVSKLNL
ncbi:MAG: hypothetical protein HeimC2_11750 [Candidatus Heimdallarchaeota archaeon LC_2]|nr:MAG: hypothetical protein HeimC2_11750 [Candidatus Heimdallarchaeota archaeon LC_2]